MFLARIRSNELKDRSLERLTELTCIRPTESHSEEAEQCGEVLGRKRPNESRDRSVKTGGVDLLCRLNLGG